MRVDADKFSYPFKRNTPQVFIKKMKRGANEITSTCIINLQTLTRAGKKSDRLVQLKA